MSAYKIQTPGNYPEESIQQFVFLSFIDKNNIILINFIILSTCNKCDDLILLFTTAKWNEIQ